MSRWQAIVFDLDDTLYPERDYVLSGFRAVATWAETYLNILAGETFAELSYLFEQGVRGNTFDRWLSTHRLHDELLVEKLVRVYREHLPDLQPFSGVTELLKLLASRYRLGLVSDGYLAVQQRKWIALGLAIYFNVVVFSDEWGRAAWKPNIIPFQVILERLGVQAAQTIYVADNATKDFLGARRLGMTTIWVRQPDGEYTHLDPPTPEHSPDLTLTSLAGFEEVLLTQDV